MWQEPITDRTSMDVQIAKNNPNDPEDLKGALNTSDLNRIEGNCRYLADQLAGQGYIVDIKTKEDWTDRDFPYQSEIDRIRDNVNALLDAYYKMIDSPDIRYWDRLDYTDVNSLEQNIENVKTLLDGMIAEFLICGTFYSGEDVIFA